MLNMLSPPPSDAEIQEELVRCTGKGGFRYWLRKYGWLEDQVRGAIRFELWPCHDVVLDALERERLIVILKARQIGMSWLLGALYPLWIAHFQTHKLCMLFSRRDDESADLIKRCRFAWSRLPEWLRAPLTRDNQMALEFGGHESRILAFPANADAGSGYAATYALADEHAKQEYAEQQFAAVRPTIDHGGQFVSSSTGKGYSTFHYKLWTDAVAGRNGFTPIFLGYGARPGRDPIWWDATRRTYMNDRLFFQEYPDTADAAFQMSESRRFRPDYLQLLASQVQPVTPHELHGTALAPLASVHSGGRGGLGFRCYQLPQKDAGYVIGVDPAEGDVNSDFSAAVVLDRAGGEEVAVLHGRFDISTFTVLLDGLATAYCASPVVVERNNHGYAVILGLQRLMEQGRRPYRLYYEQPILDAQGKVSRPGRPGWYTTAKVKPMVYDALEEAFIAGELKLATPAILEEARIVKVTPDGKIESERPFFDDLISAVGLAWQMVVRTRGWQRRPEIPYVMGQHTDRLQANFAAMQKRRSARRAGPARVGRRSSVLERVWGRVPRGVASW